MRRSLAAAALVLALLGGALGARAARDAYAPGPLDWSCGPVAGAHCAPGAPPYRVAPPVAPAP